MAPEYQKVLCHHLIQEIQRVWQLTRPRQRPSISQPPHPFLWGGPVVALRLWFLFAALGAGDCHRTGEEGGLASPQDGARSHGGRRGGPGQLGVVPSVMC